MTVVGEGVGWVVSTGGSGPGAVSTPPLHLVRRTVHVLRAADLTPAIGGSGLLVALGLIDVARDWDVTVDAPEDRVAAALDGAALVHRDATERGGVYATRRRYVVDGGDHEIDLLVGFALRDGDAIEALPSRVSGEWSGLPLADPVVWARAYRLLGRPARAELLERWLDRR